MNTILEQELTLSPWRALYWEPVTGTGERLMVGVVYSFSGELRSVRTIRKDVLDCLFGKSSTGLLNLIDESLKAVEVAARAANGLQNLDQAIFGLVPGEIRATQARSSRDLLETACLLYSSLVNLDRLDEADENDAPQQEDVSRRFGTEVRLEVLKHRPDLSNGFGSGAQLVPGGQRVRFGFSSPRAILHFTVLHPVRHSASMKDARAKIFELQQARTLSGINTAALVAGTPRLDDPTLGSKQREQLRENQLEIESEADAVNLRWYSAHSAAEGAMRVIELAG
jgi:hypothetical protein